MGKGGYLTRVLPVAKWCLNSSKVFSFPFYGKGHSQDWWPKLTKDIFYTIRHHTQQLKLRERRRKENNHGYGVSLPKQPLRGLRPCFPGSGWIPACQWEVNFYSCFVWRCSFCFTYQTVVTLNSESTILPFSPSPVGKGISKQLCGCLAAGSDQPTTVLLHTVLLQCCKSCNHDKSSGSGKLLSVQYSAKQMFSPPNKTSSCLHILCTTGITRKCKYKDVILQFTVENVGRKGLLSKDMKSARCFLICGKAVNIPWWNVYTGIKTLTVTLK